MKGEFRKGLNKYSVYLLLSLTLIAIGAIELINPVAKRNAPIEGSLGEALPPDSEMAAKANANFVIPGEAVESKSASRAEIMIDRFQEMLESDDATDEDKEGAMFRLGNLYYNDLKKYEQAAKYFQMLVDEYPDSNLAFRSYKRMAQCYRASDAYDDEKYVYSQMKNAYSNDSREYEWADEELTSLLKN